MKFEESIKTALDNEVSSLIITKLKHDEMVRYIEEKARVKKKRILVPTFGSIAVALRRFRIKDFIEVTVVIMILVAIPWFFKYKESFISNSANPANKEAIQKSQNNISTLVDALSVSGTGIMVDVTPKKLSTDENINKQNYLGASEINTLLLEVRKGKPILVTLNNIRLTAEATAKAVDEPGYIAIAGTKVDIRTIEIKAVGDKDELYNAADFGTLATTGKFTEYKVHAGKTDAIVLQKDEEKNKKIDINIKSEVTEALNSPAEKNYILALSPQNSEQDVHNIERMDKFLENIKNGVPDKVRVIKGSMSEGVLKPNKLEEYEFDGKNICSIGYDVYSKTDSYYPVGISYIAKITKSETSSGIRYAFHATKDEADNMGGTLLSYGTSKTNTSAVDQENLDQVISDMVIGQNFSRFLDTEKQFEAHKIYGTQEKDGLTYVYMYTFYGGYSFGDGKFKLQTGSSVPALIVLKKEGSSYGLVEYKEPMDGEYYSKSIKDMFPNNYAEQAIKDTGHLPQLEEQLKAKAKDWLVQQGKGDVQVQ